MFICSFEHLAWGYGEGCGWDQVENILKIEVTDSKVFDVHFKVITVRKPLNWCVWGDKSHRRFINACRYMLHVNKIRTTFFRYC